MKKLKYSFLPVLAMLCLGCNGIGIKGSGILKDENRDIEEFNSAEISGAYEIIIKCGQEPSLEIIGDDNIISLIHTEVSDGKLSIWTDKNVSFRRKVKIRITTNELEYLELSGASRVRVLNIDTHKFQLDASGAVSIYATGSTDLLDLNISGAVSADTRKLEANDVHVDLSGASNAQVNAKDLLKAQISGVGSIDYLGSPRVIKRISGLGSISQLD